MRNSTPPLAAADAADDAGQIDFACLIVSATFNGEPDISHASRLDGSSGERYRVVTIRMGGEPIVLSVRSADARAATPQDLASLIIARLSEAALLEEQIQDDVQGCLRRLAAAIKAADAGLELESIRMAPHLVERPISGDGLLLEARIIGLGERLQGVTATITAADGDTMLATLEQIVPDQRRRAKKAAQLRAEGAAVDVGAVAEAAIAFCGQDVFETTYRLLSGNPPISMEREEGSQNSASIHAMIEDGRLIVVGHLAADGRRGLLDGDWLRMNAVLEEGQLRGLVGSSPTKILPHPILTKATVAAIGLEHVPGTTDLLLEMPVRIIKSAELQHQRQSARRDV